MRPSDLSEFGWYLESRASDLVGTSIATIGVVLEVLKMGDVTSLPISRLDGSSYFLVEFVARVYTPAVGDVCKGTVTHVFSEALLLEHQGVQFIVPASDIESHGFHYAPHKEVFVQGSDMVTIGTELPIQIQVLRYRVDRFECIASMYQ